MQTIDYLVEDIRCTTKFKEVNLFIRGLCHLLGLNLVVSIIVEVRDLQERVNIH